MKRFFTSFLPLLLSLSISQAATVNWSAGIDHGFSTAEGAELATGSLVRLGWFRDSGTGLQLTDVEIQARASNPVTLNSSFVEAASSTIGSGFTPAVIGHFAASSTVNTGTGGLNVVGRQMYVWVLNAATLGAATQHAIFYWDISNTATNPDGSPEAPGVRWSFPGQDPVPGSTSVDLTDLTTGTGSLAAGAKLLVGTYPVGTSTASGAANFGLAAFSTAPHITSTSPVPVGVLNTAYAHTLTATGGTGARTWTVSAGALPNGVTLSTGGSLSGTPTQSGVFNFTALVTDDLSATDSKAFALTIAASGPSISTSSPLPNGTQGLAYLQNFGVTGGTGPFVWTVTVGSPPTGLSLSGAGALAGTPTAVGTFNFTVKVTDANSLTATAPFALTIAAAPLAITTATPLSSPVISLAYTKTLTVSGGTGSYSWTLNSGALPTGLSLSAAGVLSGTPDAASAGPYSFDIKVTDTGTSLFATKSFTMVVLAATIAPVMDVPVFPTTIVSKGTATTTYYTLTAANYPTSFIVTGLPAGLKLETTAAKLGMITGRPTASGIFNVQVKAKNAKGTSPTVTAKLIVQALPNTVVGSFVGMIARQGAITSGIASGVNGGLGGRIDLSTTATGSYTLKLVQGKTTTTFPPGVLAASVGASPQINATSGIYTVALVLDPATNLLGGTVSVSGGNNATVSGWRRVWNTASNPAVNRAGYYTMGIDLTTDMGSDVVPQGTGYASFTVGLDGGLTVSGKTADGNTLATAGFLGPTGQFLVHQVLYASLGSVVGQLTLSEDPTGSFDGNTISGPLTWFKPTNTSLTYPATFGPLTLAVDGKYMAWKSTGSVVLGLPSSELPAALSFSEGGIDLSNNLSDVAAFTYTGTVVVPMPAFGAGNPAKATLSINAASGAVTGTFTLVETTPAALTRSKVPFQGLIIRFADGTTKAAGYFLLSQIPTGGQPISKSLILSGGWEIVQ